MIRKPPQSATEIRETRILDRDMADEFMDLVGRKGPATAEKLDNGQVLVTASKEDWNRWSTA